MDPYRQRSALKSTVEVRAKRESPATGKQPREKGKACRRSFKIVLFSVALYLVSVQALPADSSSQSASYSLQDYIALAQGCIALAQGCIALLAAVISTVGLLLVAGQLREANRQNRLAMLQGTYSAILSMNQYLAENPALMLKYVGGRRYELLHKLTSAELRRVAELDLLLDHFEFRFLATVETNKSHALSLLKAQFSNPEIQKFWTSPLRGHFNLLFETSVDQIFRELAESELRLNVDMTPVNTV